MTGEGGAPYTDPVSTTSLSRNRVRAAWAIAAVGLPLLTLVLVLLRGSFNEPAQMLFFLLLVLVVAAVGGTRPALVAAVAAFIVVNWFFTPPFHTLTIEERDDLIALIVFLAVAVIVSFLATQVSTHAEAATSARAEADTLAEVDELRTAILRAVSHDLRTPLASIKASATSLLEPDVRWTEEQQREFLETIDQEVDRLDLVVGNLLDMSRIEAGTVPLKLRDLAPEDIVAGAVQSLSAAQRANARIEVRLDERVPPVHADAALLERVLANLLANALAHSPPDRPVVIDAQVTGDQVALSVVDHGIGVASTDTQRVLEPFQRLGDGRSEVPASGMPAGVGLGLAVAHGFTVAMAGRLRLSDTPGGGLTVTVTLPRGTAQEVDGLVQNPGLAR
jgi:two-component system, OmpR family, sensor histidine kinase KdpD